MRTAVCLIVRNEEDAILEWLAHYASIGFNEILVYVHKSADGTLKLAQEFGERFPCLVTEWSPQTHNPQIDAYNHCLEKFRTTFDWIAFFDGDEFLIPQHPNSQVNNFLASFDADAVCINWVTFGSGGLEDKGDKFVMEAFTTRGELDFSLNRHVKTIVRPSRISAPCNNPHWFPVLGETVSVKKQTIEWIPQQAGIVPQEKIVHGAWRLHHYYTRGLKKWRQRVARGQFGGLVVGDAHFIAHDRNEVVDTVALRCADNARSLLWSLGLEP